MGGAASQHDNELVLDVLRLSEPAFAVNGAQQIVAWNDGAERLLGLRADEVIGRRCYEALAMTHGSLCVECSNRCGPANPSTHTAEMISPVRARQILAAAKALIAASHNEHKRVNVTTLAARTRNGQLRLVHLLHDAHAANGATAATPGEAAAPAPTPIMPQSRPALPAADAGESGSRQRRPALLTQRELEVLRLLGAGHSTDDIARELSITRVTARNHVNKVLDKLGVNSRLQAVVIASQLQLI